MTKFKRFLNGILTAALSCAFAVVGLGLQNATANAATGAKVDLSGEFSSVINELPTSVTFESDSFLKEDGLVSKAELKGAYTVEFDASTTADGSAELGGGAFMITFGNQSATENIGGDQQIGKDDCVTFLATVSGIETGRGQYTASGYEVWNDKDCSVTGTNNKFVSNDGVACYFSNQEVFRFRFEVTQKGTIDVYASLFRTGTEPIYLNTIGLGENAQATGGTDGYLSILSATKGKLKLMNLKINGEKVGVEGEDAAFSIFGEKHVLQTENYFYDNTRVVSEFYVDDESLTDGETVFDVRYSFENVGQHGWTSGGAFTVSFMFGMPTREAEKTISGHCDSVWNVLSRVKQNGESKGDDVLANLAYLVGGVKTNIRFVAKKGGTLDVYVGERGAALADAPTKSYSGLNFKGYVAIDVSDTPTHPDYEYSYIDDFSVEVNEKAFAYIPYAVEFERSEVAVGVGAMVTPVCNVLPKKAAGAKMNYESDNEDVAMVDENGCIHGISRGTATVTVRLTNGRFDELEVTVLQGVTGVALNASSVSVRLGETYQLTATVAPENADEKGVVYTTSDAQVATVSESGLVTAVGGGTATITVTTNDGNFTATCTVNVEQIVTGVVLDVTYVSLTVGESATITASVNPSNAGNKAVTYSSSDESVVIVDATGKVTAVKVGTATITVTTVDGEYTDECVVEVAEAPKQETPKKKKSGCGSSASALAGVMSLLTVAAIGRWRRKRES